MSQFSEHAIRKVFHIIERDDMQLWIVYCSASLTQDGKWIDPFWEVKLVKDDKELGCIKIKQSEMLFMVEKLTTRVARDINMFNSLVEDSIIHEVDGYEVY